MRSLDAAARSEVRFRRSRRADRPAGVATGLVWTPAGGDIVFVEAIGGPGQGQSTLTGQLGDVMRESAKRRSATCAPAPRLGIARVVLRDPDIHVHVPGGAVPKDGPSAGVTIAVAALILALTGRLVRDDVAMTGEITLRGKVLPVGGMKEKVLGAHRAGIRTVVLPRNERDLDEIPAEVRRELGFHLRRRHGRSHSIRLRGKPAGASLSPPPAPQPSQRLQRRT